MFTKRVVAKTVTYKGVTFLTSFGGFMTATGDPVMAASLSAILVAINVAVYMLHELLWAKTDWGRST